MPDDIPSLADLRRTRARRPRTLSLFDAPQFDREVTPADILAEQSRSLYAPGDTQPNPLTKALPAVRVGPPSAQDLAVRVGSQDVFTVAELVRQVRSFVEGRYAFVTVDGEISNWRPAASGHCYFTLKDGDAQLSIVLFRRQAALLRFKPKDGDAVRIRGSLSVYESRGQLQLVADFMQQTGLGALLAAVQQLKERLRREGVFTNKRPLPAFPRCIGVITSLHGAALRDIVKVCRRRHAAVNLLIYPAAVQGPNCAAEVAAGVRYFGRHAQRPHDPSAVEVILIARGGGSWEDLHGFDDEALARTIAASAVPVLTGIGHATDSTLADAAADLCAPTPSAAAELVTAAQHGVAGRLDLLHARLLRATRYNLLRARQRISILSANSLIRRARTTAQRLDDLTFRAENALTRAQRNRTHRLVVLDARLHRQHPSLRLAEDGHHLQSLQQRLHAGRQRPLEALRTRLDRSTAQLHTLSPLRVLDRGYALVYTANGRLLRSAAEAPAGVEITARLAQGQLTAKVTSTE